MKVLTKNDIDLITSKVIEIHDQQRETVEKKEKDRRLRNTKLLLRNYRTFKEYAREIEKESNNDWEGIDTKELVIFGEDLAASIKQTTRRTLVMIRHIDQALLALEFICEQEKLVGDSKQFDILYARYVEGHTIAETAVAFCINDRSVYKVIDAAVERLSVILFGVYGLRIE